MQSRKRGRRAQIDYARTHRRTSYLRRDTCAPSAGTCTTPYRMCGIWHARVGAHASLRPFISASLRFCMGARAYYVLVVLYLWAYAIMVYSAYSLIVVCAFICVLCVLCVFCVFYVFGVGGVFC